MHSKKIPAVNDWPGFNITVLTDCNTISCLPLAAGFLIPIKRRVFPIATIPVTIVGLGLNRPFLFFQAGYLQNGGETVAHGRSHFSCAGFAGRSGGLLRPRTLFIPFPIRSCRAILVWPGR